MKTHYEVLGVPTSADREAIRHAYLDLARSHHPDAGGDPAVMRQVNDAWKVLGSERARRSYDIAIGVIGASALRARPADDDDEPAPEQAWDLADLSAVPLRAPSRRAAAINSLSLFAVLVLGALTAVCLLLGMMLMIGELLGFGVFLGFLTAIAVMARMVLAMGRSR